MNNIPKIKSQETCYTSQRDGKCKVDSKKDRKLVSPTLQGVLLTKSREDNNYSPNSSLIITTPKEVNSTIGTSNEPVKSFDIKKALTPLAIGTISLFGVTAGLSAILRSSAKTILKAKPWEQLPDLALNMNIRQEPQFATYMMLRNPNFKTVMGALGVFAMSGITLISKNFVDGAKEIWVKKQESDIQRDLQENLIETETKVFSGKLQIERNILGETAQYFDKLFNKNTQTSHPIHKMSNTFKSISNFCGKKEKDSSIEKNNNLLYGILLAATAVSGILIGKITFKNLKKTSDLANKYKLDFAENTKLFIDKVAENKNPKDLEKIEGLFETILATPKYIKETLSKMNVSEEDIKRITDNTQESVKKIFSDAPVALGGIPKKIQYYCYLDEDRGHLYNWIMHPENTFMKYLFLASASISATGYIAKQCVDALKTIAVSKENSNTELSLQKRLIDVELKNFESKKKSAINPLLDEFNKRLNDNTTEEELKNMADNILLEIKNGAPYVYS